MKKYALFSLDKTENIPEFATVLIEHGFHILASSETVSLLRSKNIAVEDIKDFTAFDGSYPFPPTLHPKVEYSLTTQDAKESIDIVFDITYPFDKGIDIGGHTLLALAIKGNRIPVTNSQDMFRLIDQLKQNGSIADQLKKELQESALIKIITYYNQLLPKVGSKAQFYGTKENHELINGENPYQVPAFLSEVINTHPRGYQLVDFNKIQGPSPCYTNLADLDNLLNTLYLTAKAFERKYNKVPYIAVAAKHGNPCGLAIDWDSPAKAIEQSLWGNARAVWGGEFVCNFLITAELAQLLHQSSKREELIGSEKWMLDVIAVPEVDLQAKEILKKRERAKVYINQNLFQPQSANFFEGIKSVRGGLLVQPPNDFILDFSNLDYTSGIVKSEQVASLIIAWAVAYTSFHGGNEIALARDNALIAAAGGPSTYEAAKFALVRAEINNHSLEGAVFAADAFFPFTDAPEVLGEAGCIAGVVPAGGINHQRNVEFFKENNIDMGFISEEYRGFCRH